MEVLVCVKRVPAPGAKIVLTEDARDIDTRHLGFTVSPHEECAVEEAIRIVERHGGSATVLTLGPPEAEEQLRNALSLGADHAVLLPIEGSEWDPQATAAAVGDAVEELEAERGGYDLILFGNESADAGNFQLGIRVAHRLGRPVVSGIKGIEVGEGGMRLQREIPDGVEVYDLTLPAVAAVKEGINLPRYPSLKGRLAARKAEIRVIEPERRPGGLRKLRLVQPETEETETVILGEGGGAAPRIVDLFEELGLL